MIKVNAGILCDGDIVVSAVKVDSTSTPAVMDGCPARVSEGVLTRGVGKVGECTVTGRTTGTSGNTGGGTRCFVKVPLGD